MAFIFVVGCHAEGSSYKTVPTVHDGRVSSPPWIFATIVASRKPSSGSTDSRRASLISARPRSGNLSQVVEGRRGLVGANGVRMAPSPVCGNRAIVNAQIGAP
jgi:hypothetical protein